MKHKLTVKDFDSAFDFALKYHLEPKKSQSSRTSGATRGLGGVFDSFVRGKLVEIGVASALKTLNSAKDFVLDFDIKGNKEVICEPDITVVIENGRRRAPKCFLEIKNVSKDDRWIGLHLEQFETMKKSSDPENIFVIGAYIENNNTGNSKEKDLLGIYLKNKFRIDAFKDFTNLTNIEVVIEYAISGKELHNQGKIFKKGSFMYETEIFEEVGLQTITAINSGRINKIGTFSGGVLDRYLMDSKFPDPEFMGEFKCKGNFCLYEKINEKSVRRYIQCNTNVEVSSNYLGNFMLEKGKIYLFNLSTMGRNPALNRNNIWIAKRSVSFLQNKKILSETESNLKKIASEI